MKFGHELLSVQQDCPPEWRDHWLKYKALKKLIKKMKDGGDHSVEERQFLTLLNAEVASINRTFEAHARQLLARSRLRTQKHQRCCCSLLQLVLVRGRVQDEELARKARWCRQYAAMNATALRKIAKKHDKYCHSSAGQQFLQACWDCRNTNLGAFLHSPLIDELRALEALSDAYTASQAARATSSAAGAARSSGGDAPPGGSTGQPPLSWLPAAAAQRGVAHPAAAADDSPSAAPQDSCSSGGYVPPQSTAHARELLRQCSPQQGGHQQLSAAVSSWAASGAVDHAEIEPIAEGASDATEGSRHETALLSRAESSQSSCSMDSSFRCAICLEPMWMPVGLSCGHAFCAECIFHAVGVNDWMKPLPEVLADVPPLSTCPKCRQRYVFGNVIELKELGAVIRYRYPDEVGDRAAELVAELNAKRKEHKAAVKQERRSRLQQLMQPFAAGL